MLDIASQIPALSRLGWTKNQTKIGGIDVWRIDVLEAKHEFLHSIVKIFSFN